MKILIVEDDDRIAKPLAEDLKHQHHVVDVALDGKEVSIPVQILKTEDRPIVAIVFERVNRLGMKLDTLQLLSAWTWNEDFDLLESFKKLKEDLEEFGFSEVAEDSDLILKCASAVLKQSHHNIQYICQKAALCKIS